MSIHDLKFLQEKVNKLKEDGVYRVLPVLNGKNSSTIVLDGKEMVNLSANNYLGLANDPDLIRCRSRCCKNYYRKYGFTRRIGKEIGNFQKISKSIYIPIRL